jgi:peptidoglycan/xylan/chitin deacetylase (PgdA/CDA1 family)
MFFRRRTTPILAARRRVALRRTRRARYASALVMCVFAAGLLIACSGSEGAAPLPTPTPSLSPTPTILPPTPTASATPSPTVSPTPSWVPGTPWPGPANLPILMYHHINSQPQTSELDASLTVTDADFARQLDYLRCAGYSSVTLSQLYDGIYLGAPLPPKPVVVTFDDGYKDAFWNAFPALYKRGFGGSFSIITNWVGAEAFMNWEEIAFMANSGMEMTSHTLTHEDLNKSPDDIVRQQLTLSRAALEEHLQRPVLFFVYPAGEPFRRGTPQRQAQVVQMVQEAGYRGALLASNKLQQNPAAPYAFNRIRVSGGVDIRKFAENMGAPLPETIGC